MPSSKETWGLVANEALACGTPIVVSDAVGCAPDLAGDGTAGRVFPLGDIRALSGALAELLISPPRREAITAKSDAYSVAAAVDGLRRAFEAVRLSSPRRVNP
jgi:glycosyltransferase involved in cell wall biosynthesis